MDPTGDDFGEPFVFVDPVALLQGGDWGEKDESLAEIVTDQIKAECPSPIAGRLAKILVQTDEMVPVGSDIALIEENADVSASPPPEPAPGPDAAPLKSSAQATRPVVEARPASTGDGASAASQTPHVEEEERQRISPLARRLAREHGVDLHIIAGTGTGGRVSKGDILAYVAQLQAAATPRTPYAAPSTTVPPPAPIAAPTAQPVPQPAYTATAADYTALGA